MLEEKNKKKDIIMNRNKNRNIDIIRGEKKCMKIKV